MILVTGGSGYLGSLTAKFLINKGYKVRIATRNKNLVDDSLFNKVDIFKIDLLNQENINNCCKNIDIVIHFAAMNYLACEKDPFLAKKINVEATEKLLSAVKKNKINKFIYLSTTHIYGNNLNGKINEEYLPSPNNFYSITHLDAEKKILEHAKEDSKIKYLILRLSNIIATPISKNIDCWHLVGHDLCKQAIVSNKLELTSSGEQYRDFIGINQLLNVISIFISESKFSGTYNFSSGNSIKVKKLADIIQKEYYKIFQKQLPLLINSSKLDTNYLYEFDNSKIKKEFQDLKFDTINSSIKNLLLFCKNFF